MSSTQFSNILLDKSPKKINNIVERILDILFKINEVVREVNSVDFCNPLGYILTKSLPPGGLIDSQLKEYGGKITKFVNNVEQKITLNNVSSNIGDNLEEIRLSLEEIIPNEELKRIIPGGDGILETIQILNDSLVLSTSILSTQDKKLLLKSFTSRLIPLMNPISFTEALVKDQANNLNSKFKNIIQPERFRSSLISLIKLIITIDKSIAQIESVVILINKIIKTINVLIKIFTITITILKLLPMPAKYVTVGVTVTASSKVSKIENDIIELGKLLNSVSTYLNNVVVIQIKRIRNEIFALLIGLNQLLENISSCDVFKGDNIINEIQNGIDTLNNNIVTLENIFPSINSDDNDTNTSYKGYKLLILDEDTTDNNTSLFRKRVIVVNNKDIIEYEGTPTYASNIQVLIKEGQYYIDQKNEINTTSDNNNINDDDLTQVIQQIGLDSKNIETAIKKSELVSQKIKEQINSNSQDKELYELVQEDNENPNTKRIKNVEKITKIIISTNKNPLLIQNKLKRMTTSLIKKGYTDVEINKGIKNIYNNNIIIN